MGDSFFINFKSENANGVKIESKKGETVLSSFNRAGAALSAPCGGRGVCGKCRLTLLDGEVCLKENGAVPGAKKPVHIKPGGAFPACRAMPLSDITVCLPPLTAKYSAPLSVIQAERKIKRAGAAIDIGTTTVQAELIDLDTGECMETFFAPNDQRGFGADVMSRICAAKNGKLDDLFRAINNQTENLLRHYINRWNLDGIEQCAVSGNTTMLHIFCRADPSPMGEAPYAPQFLEERIFKGGELSLSARQVVMLPGISAFVGADITSGLAFIDIMNRKENSLFVDIGTNGEMAVWNESEKRLLCCSTAAGPCFEGAQISCGMSASDFIDTIALMKRTGAINAAGALAEEYSDGRRGGYPASGGIVTQKDVREFQLAKSAIYSGIKTLCASAASMPAEIEPQDFDSIYIAGGLGFFINLESAAETGLLPRFLNGGLKIKTAVCGNTSLMGAVKSMTDPSFLPRCREIIKRSSVIDLAKSEMFAREFTDNMWF
ncbi:MAG: ASKHA domain-containing protein [Treponema sp.]|jgi:uncharacterized 2Fe-2S/4Fe-4S cluster protein (DUF4445 family)|nr:ASKHA domain-containing protein [Treponema sp.]